MVASTRKFAAAALAAIGLSAGLAGAVKADVLPVTNLTFNQFTSPGVFTPDKTLFTTANPTGWSIGAPGKSGNLIGVGVQGSESEASGGLYAVYPGTGFSNTVPTGTNFFQADGNPDFESTILQSISGLTPGTTYTLQFQQAAGQQQGFTQDTTEQWLVYLGVGGIGTHCPGVNTTCSVTGDLLNNIANPSPMMSVTSGQIHDWESVDMSFTPELNNFTSFDAQSGTGTAVLTFLAWGNGGSNENQPPTVFLEGVNTPPIPTPEPATLTLLGVGVLGVAGIVRRRRGKRNVAG